MPKDEAFMDMNENELINTFHEMFFNELESWFSADIACCDNCYNVFLSKWPAVYSRDLEFQRSGIDLRCFYTGSYLQDVFTVEEFNKFIGSIHCPRCGSSLYANIWPYNFNFNMPDDFENTLIDISNLAMRTPFIILSHPFAYSTYKEIERLGADAKPVFLDNNFFRARKIKEGKVFSNDDFKYPPRAEISEGRYNHAGYPVIYLSDSETTCFYELRKPEEGIAVAEIKIKKPLKILDLFEIGDKCDNILNAAAWSSLMSSPDEGDGWYKPHYVFTRFIADCTINAGFDGIRYPSIRLGERSNLVLLDGIAEWKNIDVTKIWTMTNEELQKQILRYKMMKLIK